MTPPKEETRADVCRWVALSSVYGVGSVLFKRLMLRFGAAGAVFGAPEHELGRVEGVRPDTVRAIKAFTGWDEAEEELVRARDAGAEIVTMADPRYPPNLKEVHDPPPYLYVKGTLLTEDRISVAMVGSRMASEYGRRMTRNMSGELAARGITIVSGGARGIDTEAHRGALGAGGRTIVVLGCGIDVAYPAENRALFEEAAASGAVVTEYPVGTQPAPENFPARNRIISGVSLGVVVMEAAEDSGSLITATYSLEQGREVYALPGSVSSPTSRGTNSLIKKGAKLVDGASDILLDLFPYMKGYLGELRLDGQASDGAGGEALPRPEPNLGPDEKALYEHLTIEPMHVDVVSEKAGMPVGKALSLLLGMELRGLIRQLSGMRYVREN